MAASTRARALALPAPPLLRALLLAHLSVPYFPGFKNEHLTLATDVSERLPKAEALHAPVYGGARSDLPLADGGHCAPLEGIWYMS